MSLTPFSTQPEGCGYLYFLFLPLDPIFSQPLLNNHPYAVVWAQVRDFPYRLDMPNQK
jgi:hypothetical protein